MELRKRILNKQIPFDQSKPKKQKKNQLKEITKIEHFPAEIWLEIFSYFDGNCLIELFSQLNSFVQCLLNDYHLKIHLNISKIDFEIPYPFNSNQIRSISLNYSNINKNEIIDISSFVHLRSLYLININDQQLEKTSQFKFNSLHKILIKSKDGKYLTKILSLYFPNINKLIINSLENAFIVKSFKSYSIKSRIQNLVLHGTIKLAKLFRLWPSVPDLRSFSIIDGGIHQCDYWIDQEIISQKRFPPLLSYLHINLYDDDMTFSNLENLIPKSVIYMKINGSIADDDLDDYLSSINWLRLISNCSKNLQSIQLNLSSYFDPNDSSGLHKTLTKFRKDSFFRNTTIQSKNFLITIQGYLKPEIC